MKKFTLKRLATITAVLWMSLSTQAADFVVGNISYEITDNSGRVVAVVAGQSKYTLGKMLGLALNGITAFSVKPLYVIFNIGMLFLVIAFGIAVYVAYALITGAAVPGWSSLILSIWLVGGFILISMGIIGAYVGKIFTEVKQRPLYHVQEILKN